MYMCPVPPTRVGVGGGGGGGEHGQFASGAPVYKGAHANSAGLVQITSSSSVTFQSKGLNMLLCPLNNCTETLPLSCYWTSRLEYWSMPSFCNSMID